MQKIERLFNVINRSLFYSDSSLSYGRTLEAIGKLADIVNEYDDEINWCLGESGECTLDVLLVGAYWYCADYHGGQWSDEYRVNCQIGQFFSPNMSCFEEDTTEHVVYAALVKKRTK